MDNIHEQEKGTFENFMFLFSKLFNESKYNLQSLNKRFESLEKCINNICILNTEEPFNEDVNEEDEPMELTMADLDLIEKEFSPEKKSKRQKEKEKKENEKKERKKIEKNKKKKNTSTEIKTNKINVKKIVNNIKDDVSENDSFFKQEKESDNDSDDINNFKKDNKIPTILFAPEQKITKYKEFLEMKKRKKEEEEKLQKNISSIENILGLKRKK
jgi:hypothetical protein